MPPATSILHRITAENHVPAEGSPTQAQERGAAFFKQNVLPAIERVMQKFDAVEETIRIDKLELDLNIEDWDRDFDAAIRQFEARLEEILTQIINKKAPIQKKQNVKHTNSFEADFELFMELITTGQLPWWSSDNKPVKLNELATRLFQNPTTDFVSRIKQGLAQSHIRQRLALRLSSQNIKTLITLVAPQAHKSIQLITEVSAFAVNNSSAFLQLEPFMNEVALSLTVPPEKTSHFIENILSNSKTSLPASARLLANEALEYFRKEEKKNGKENNKVEKESEDKKPTNEENTNEQIKSPENKRKPLQENKNSNQKQNPEIEKNSPHDKKENQQTAEDKEIENTQTTLKKILNPVSTPETEEETNENRQSDPDKLEEAKELNSNAEKEELPVQETPSLVDEEDALGNYYVNNAGIIILAPFLPAIFKELELIESGKFISTEAQEKAICLLHYLLTDEEEFEEHYMLLNKILCGMPVHNPLIYNIHLTEKDKEECQNLLAAVAKHWTALKNTSPQNMRSAFFWRNARIEHLGNGWNIKIERNSIDILVDKLPWGISIIKQPWNEEAIFVDWT